MTVVKIADDDSDRVLIFAPVGRDGPVSFDLLRRSGLNAELCSDLSGLISEIGAGAAVVFVAEEGLFGNDLAPLTSWITRQPPWSDLPFVVLTSHHEHASVAAWRQKLVTILRNVALLERPVQPITLSSAVRAALRARRRQYEVRDLLAAQENTAAQLEALVTARTQQLETVNDELRRQMEERARIEQSLRQAQRIEAIGQLTGGVAHDFNNLLMVISGGLGMLDRQADAARRKRLMDGMRQAAERGASLTRQLLAFSRQQPLQPQAVDLFVHIGAMRDLLDRSLSGDVHVRLELAEDLWPIEVDPGELELVIFNLAVNARDAMPNGGTITFRGENVPNWRGTGADFVRLAVVDTGSGMSPEVQAHAFEPFFTTKDIGKGSGLGLPQTYGFAQQSGGSVHIESEVGSGTSIVLMLPRSTKPVAAPGESVEAFRPAQPPARSAGCVLLVEDDNEVANLVQEMLDQLGYQVILAGSANSALGALANGRTIDLVFSDVMMPGGMNGVDLAREIRVRRPGLPVLLTSGVAEAAKRAAGAAGIPVLQKPYSLDQLAAALAGVAPAAAPTPEAGRPSGA